MFWMMNEMGPRGGRRMHHRGYDPMGGLFLLPGILFGGLFGIYAILAVLNVVGVVIGAVLSGLGAAFYGVMSGIGSAFSRISGISGIGSTGGLIIGIVIGIIGYYRIRNRNARSDEEES